MKRAPSAFTLIEMLVVMAVMAILASIIVSINGMVQRKAALIRATDEIHGLMAACENYKGDQGAYPRTPDANTDIFDARTEGTPTDPRYAAASQFLYKELSGDHGPGATPRAQWNAGDQPDGRPETKAYFEFSNRPSMLKKNGAGTVVEYLIDPFGNSYGYSTIGAALEESFRPELAANPNAPRTNIHGFNPTFDLWSTGGVIHGGTGPTLVANQKRWVKNW